MKPRIGYSAFCAVLLLIASAQAVIPYPLPPINIRLEPANPTASQTFGMRISGFWPDGCPPRSLVVSTGAGPSMWIDLILAGANDPDCEARNCGSKTSSYEVFASSVGPFDEGLYDVYVRAVDCDAIGRYELQSQRIRIGFGDGQQPAPDKGFARGQRVVLLEDDPISGLRSGQAGTIICCDDRACEGRVLVSWDLWAHAKDDPSACLDAVIPSFPTGSAVWVDPDQIMIGRPFNQCGVVRKGLEGCIEFEADDGLNYTILSGGDLFIELNTRGGIEFGQRLRLRGLLDTNIPRPNVFRICRVLDGDIYHPILSPCDETKIGCCAGRVFPGDRVILQVDNPRGPQGAAPGLRAGTLGTVICCEGPYGPDFVFVSWDNWNHGVNSETSCDSTMILYARNSGWWVPCDQIILAKDGDDDGFVVRVGADAIRIERDLTAPNPNTSFIGCTTATVQANFRARLSVEVTPTSAAGGDWTGSISPEIVEAGTTVVEICVRGENVDVTAVPPGRDRQLASTSVFAVPAPRR